MEEENKNKLRLDSFVEYCEKNPELRFWQALQSWAFLEYRDHFPDKPEIHCIFAGFDKDASEDTFNWD